MITLLSSRIVSSKPGVICRDESINLNRWNALDVPARKYDAAFAARIRSSLQTCFLCLHPTDPGDNVVVETYQALRTL